ncbi:hypothetical protein DFH06DRAFT_1132548 [Mycena polygramma]|nr:hypothetical protein DFH06DRAFT_1132548 [Mycena polygramma]
MTSEPASDVPQRNPPGSFASDTTAINVDKSLTTNKISEADIGMRDQAMDLDSSSSSSAHSSSTDDITSAGCADALPSDEPSRTLSSISPDMKRATSNQSTPQSATRENEQDRLARLERERGWPLSLDFNANILQRKNEPFDLVEDVSLLHNNDIILKKIRQRLTKRQQKKQEAKGNNAPKKRKSKPDNQENELIAGPSEPRYATRSSGKRKLTRSHVVLGIVVLHQGNPPLVISPYYPPNSDGRYQIPEIRVIWSDYLVYRVYPNSDSSLFFKASKTTPSMIPTFPIRCAEITKICMLEDHYMMALYLYLKKRRFTSSYRLARNDAGVPIGNVGNPSAITKIRVAARATRAAARARDGQGRGIDGLATARPVGCTARRAAVKELHGTARSTGRP